MELTCDFCWFLLCFQSAVGQEGNRKAPSEFCLHRRTFLVRLIKRCLDTFIKNVTLYNVHLKWHPTWSKPRWKEILLISVRYFTQVNVYHLNLEDSANAPAYPLGNTTKAMFFLYKFASCGQFCICHGVGRGTSTVVCSDSSMVTCYPVVHFFVALLNFSILEEGIRSELCIYINLRLLHLKIFCTYSGLRGFSPGRCVSCRAVQNTSRNL